MKELVAEEVASLLAFGWMDWKAGYPEYARQYFEQVLVLDPENTEAEKALAAIEQARRAVEAGKETSKKVMRKRHGIAEWVGTMRIAYAGWVDKRRWKREKTAAERLAAEERRREAMVEWEAEEYREWYWTGVAGWEMKYGGDELYDAIVHGGLLLDDGDYWDFF